MFGSFRIFVLSFLLVGCVLAQDKDDRPEEKAPKGIVDAAAEPLLKHVRNLTRQLIKTAQGFVDSVDTQTVAVGEQVRQVAGEVGKNALGDIVDSMQFFRERVRRLHSVTRSSQSAVQRILDNDKVSIAVKTPLFPISLLLSTLESNVAALRKVTDSGAEDPIDRR